MFILPIMSSSFRFTEVERIAVPTTGIVNYFRSLRERLKRSLYGKKDLTLQVLLKISIKFTNTKMGLTWKNGSDGK